MYPIVTYGSVLLIRGQQWFVKPTEGTMKKLHASIPAQVFLLMSAAFLFSSSARTYQVTGTLVCEHRNPISSHQVVLYDDNDVQKATGQTDSQGNFTLSYQGEPTSAEPGDRPDGPSEFALGSSYPNPFNPRTVVPFEVPESTNAVIAIYNILGQEVLRTRAGLAPGSHEIVVNLGQGMSQGTYLLRVQGAGYSLTQAMTFLSAGVSSGQPGVSVRSVGQRQGALPERLQTTSEAAMYRIVIEGTEVYQHKEVLVPAMTDHHEGEIRLFFQEPEELLDSDGNSYPVIRIGDDWWMAANLKTTRYRNGDPIPNVSSNSEWSGLVTGAYCAYNNFEGNAETYGYLYNWHAVNDVRNIAPEGWRVPSDAEWQAMINALGGNTVAGGKLKATGTEHWDSPNTGATNEVGFSALPGGFRSEPGEFYYRGLITGFWSDTGDDVDKAWYRALAFNTAAIDRSSGTRGGGFSVRLIRDTSPEPSMTGIEIRPKNESAEAGESVQFYATAHFSDLSKKGATGASEWSVTPSEAGDIDENGLFTASSSFIGSATIIASYNEFTDQADLTITPETGTMTDQNGNAYQTVRIGNQWWTTENLRATHYRNGDLIQNVTGDVAWSQQVSGAYAAYNNVGVNVPRYGYLYNWHAVNDVREITPEGWRVPSDAEWQELVDFLGGYSIAGGKLKQTGTMYWNSPNTGATNESGFRALPGGRRNSNGSFVNLGSIASFWSSTKHSEERAWHYRLDADNTNVNRLNNRKEFGFSIRLIKDTKPPHSMVRLEIIARDYPLVGLGDQKQFEARIVHKDGSEKNATSASIWSVSPSYAGGIDGNGLFTASLSYTGQATITASYDEFADDVDIMIVPATGTMTDQDGNVYRTVKIGDQWWMAENLRVTHYRNGDPIALVSSNSAWSDHVTGAYCAYNNSENQAAKYGYLYNGFSVVDTRNIAPAGWRVPGYEDWKTLEMHLGMSSSEVDKFNFRGTDEGGKLKATGTGFWLEPNTGATNESGFTALPGGMRNENGEFIYLREDAYFWSSLSPGGAWADLLWMRSLNFNEPRINRDLLSKKNGYSVRLVRDD